MCVDLFIFFLFQTQRNQKKKQIWNNLMVKNQAIRNSNWHFQYLFCFSVTANDVCKFVYHPIEKIIDYFDMLIVTLDSGLFEVQNYESPTAHTKLDIWDTWFNMISKLTIYKYVSIRDLTILNRYYLHFTFLRKNVIASLPEQKLVWITQIFMLERILCVS